MSQLINCDLQGLGLLDILKLMVQSDDSNGFELKTDCCIEDYIDEMSQAVKTITNSHHKIHEGDHYYAYHYIQLDDTNIQMYVITTADTLVRAHTLFIIQGALDTEVTIHEDTARTGTNPLVEHNNDRNSANTASVVYQEGAGAGADGTEIFGTRFGVDVGPGVNRAFGGGQARGDAEIILKQNTKYLVTITSHSDNNNISFMTEWYENS